jgi:hypothetical protein
MTGARTEFEMVVQTIATQSIPTWRPLSSCHKCDKSIEGVRFELQVGLFSPLGPLGIYTTRYWMPVVEVVM